MSLTLNMVGGGGGGGLTATDAILRVQAPSLSTVTISKGGVTKSDQGHENKDRPTTYDYYFIIHQSQFDSVNAWTVTATRGTESNSTTIIINASDEYNVSIGYHVPIDLYQEVEYLANTGSSYIVMSDFTAPTNLKAEFRMASSENKDGMFSIMASSPSSSSARSEVYMLSYKYAAYTYAGSDSSINQTFSFNEMVNFRFERTSNTQKLTLVDFNLSVSDTQTTNPTIINFFRYVGTSTYNCKARFAHAAFYNSSTNTLESELYPCYRLSDSVAGLYDRVRNKFYTNNGSGTFTVGADV